MSTRDLAALAAGLAAGSYTHDAVLSKLGGNHELMDKVLGIAAGFGAGAVASSLTKTIIDETPLRDVCSLADDAIGGIFDLF